MTAVALLVTPAVVGQEPVGYVLDIDGDWYLTKNSLLKKGSALPSEGLINAGSPDDVNNYIVIADRNGRIFERRNCRDPRACERPIRLPKLMQNSPSLAARIVDAVMGLWVSDPARYRTFGVRGEAASLREAVVLMADGFVNLSRPFGTIKEGEYLIRFVDPSDQRVVLMPVRVRVAPGVQPSIAAGTLVPGLYEIQLLDKYSSEPQAVGTEAWILVSRPSDYERYVSSFDQAVKVTKGWSNVDKTTISGFLRTYLAHLAQDAKK